MNTIFKSHCNTFGSFTTTFKALRKYKRCYIKVLTLACAVSMSFTTHAKVTLVFTSNQPDILFNKNIAHFPQLATLLNTLKNKKDSNTLFLHGGDSFSPSAMSLFDNANNVIALANMMDVSLYAVGKRELTYDVDILSLRAHDAQFPIVSSNVLDKRTHSPIEGLFTTYDFHVDDLRISVGSLINPRVIVAYGPKFAEIIDRDRALQNIVKRQQGADLKILMTDLEEAASLQIAEKQDFDLILVAIDGPDKQIKVKGTQIVLAGGQDGEAAIIEFDNKATGSKLTARIDSLDKYFPDPGILSFIDKYKRRLGDLYKEEIAVAASDFSTVKRLIRTRETALANVFVDAVREDAQTEIAIVNSGSIRNSEKYPKGYKFTRGDIQSEFPFGGHHVAIEIDGTGILAMLENSLSRIKFEDGRFLNISGMQVIYNSKAPVGSRILSVKIAGKPLEKLKLYSMAIPDFYLAGGDEYTMLENLKTTSNIFNKQRTWHVVAKYLSKQKSIIAPPLNRMIDKAKNEN
jgi:2',3'-cyclic-nucleotide 2'-phosphodiesterase (5'-nucleotidase family)